MGYSGEMLARPVVGIADSRSGFNNCHRHFPELIEAVKRGVLAAGGLPIEFPTVSLGEVFLSPTSMMFRNLMSIDVEEMIRAQPMDAVVLVGGCDKTVPAQLMGALSADVPAVQLLAGPMMPTSFRGERLGACTDCRRFWAMHRAGKGDGQGIDGVEGNLASTAGTGAVLRELAPLLHLDCMTVAGATLGEILEKQHPWVDRAVVRPFGEPLARQGGLVALFGSLAPNGAILKRSAADPSLFEREGRAVVFASLDDLAARIDAPDLDVKPDDFLVLQNAGPKSGYAMPEAGYLPIPAKLARTGVKDMVRISDARMSGTAYGTIVLHVSPEAAVGGPLALVKT